MEDERLYAMNCAAEEWFMSQMKGGYLDYMRGRGISDDILRTFGIGASGTDRDAFVRFMEKKGFTDSDLTEGTLLTEGGTLFFSDRIMFPIMNEKGIVGFSGRLTTKTKDMKYKNTPENQIFQKRRTLYNFENARKTGSDTVVICEGQMDAIAMTRAGHPSVISLMGTKLTEEHLAMLKSRMKTAVICLDGDQAGQLNAQKVGEYLQKNGFIVRNVLLPEGKDPDELMRDGKEALDAAMKLKTLTEAQTDRIAASYRNASPSGGRNVVFYDHSLDIAYDAIAYMREFSTKSTAGRDAAYISKVTGFSQEAVVMEVQRSREKEKTGRSASYKARA